MDLFVDALDSKLQPSERYKKLVINKKINKTGDASKSSDKNKNISKKTKSTKSQRKKLKNTDNDSDTKVSESDKKEPQEDEIPTPFLNTLIDSCTEVVRAVNQLCTEHYHTSLSTRLNPDKLSKINKKCEKSIENIKSLVKKVASDQVFDKDANPLHILFDEIEYGLKKHTKAKYETSVLEGAGTAREVETRQIESDQENKEKLEGEGDETVKDGDSDPVNSKRSLRRSLYKYEKATLNSYSLNMDTTKYKLPDRPQDKWKDSIDNFTTKLHKNTKYEKYNQIEPQIKYNKEYKEVFYFEKNFVPKIYPKYELLSSINKDKGLQAHLYTQELNSLVWSDEKLNSTHQGYNILGGEWNIFEATELKSDLFDKEVTPDYKMVLNEEEFDDMMQMIQKSSILSIDVEHHDLDTYRGYICLIQLSIPDENYVVDPFNMFTHMNNLNRVTTDPKILKVMHGSSNDIVWLQRDFGVYIVNLFDTREAAKILNLSGQSLSKLIDKYFDIKLNKKYQLSDWSKRPLDQEMLNYACSDSHYLIPLYVNLKNEILSKSDGKIKMIQVMNNCRNICLRQYSDKGIEINQKFKNIVRRNKIQISTLDFVSYNFMLNLISFRNYAARKLDVSEQMVIRDYQISIIVKKMKSGQFYHLVSLLCDHLNLIKYEIANLIKIKNTIEMIYKKMNKSELILIRPRSIHFILNCLNNNNLDQRHTACIDNTLKIYNKFVAGGFFNNISPIQLDMSKMIRTETKAEESTNQKRSLVEEANMVEDWKRKKLNI